MNWDDFEANVKLLAPAQPLGATRYWIGVLHHTKSPNQQLVGDDFLWMSVRNNVAMQKIRETYTIRYGISNINLEFRDTMVAENDAVSSFLHPDQNFVLFQAQLFDRVIAPDVDIRDLDRSDSTPATDTEASNIKDEDTSQLELHNPLENVQSVASPERGGSPGDSKPTDHFLSIITEQGDPDFLEAAVGESLRLIEEFRHCFAQHADYNKYAQNFLESINSLQDTSGVKQIIIGVVGNTGAGKSSVINALIEEERLVPTNCMRSCTAVVTEISWNSSKDPESKYRAKIEFITREDWEKELLILVSEFLTEEGELSTEAKDHKTDAGIAWSKFHAVYPNIDRGSLKDCNIAALVADPELDFLGTIRNIQAATSTTFYEKLHDFVDSKEKVRKNLNSEGQVSTETLLRSKAGKRAKRKKNKVLSSLPLEDSEPGYPQQNRSRKMEYWPLVKVVKIYTRAPALSTGAIVVDLPGFQDSNAARASIAHRYIQQCTSTWIVSPITRAVDDKAAKTLLGDSFRRQLKYDGGLADVTFICSKADDISISEATEALKLEDAFRHLYEREEQCNQDIAREQVEIDELERSVQASQTILGSISTELHEYFDRQKSIKEGIRVYGPSPTGSKRKRDSPEIQPRKRPPTNLQECGTSVAPIRNISDPNVDDDEDEIAVHIPLDEAGVEARIQELLKESQLVNNEIKTTKPKLKDKKSYIAGLNAKIEEIKAEIRSNCISGRNSYARTAIRQDFAAGLKELDHEVALEEDEDHFNPNEERRNYAEIAQSLPVFCVSSRAYQQQCGRLQKDDSVSGFRTAEETEMPLLQTHCRKLTEASRIQNGRAFLLGLCQQLVAFELWATDNTSSSDITEEERQKRMAYIQGPLSRLETELSNAVGFCISNIETALRDSVFCAIPRAVKDAINEAPKTVQGWGLKKEDGGLAYTTYKAAVRRDGTYTSSTVGQVDFNVQLAEPIVKRLAQKWERTFQDRVPNKLAAFNQSNKTLIKQFQSEVKDETAQDSMDSIISILLDTQIVNYQLLFSELYRDAIGEISTHQREANRRFVPEIIKQMHHVYKACAKEHGSGSFKRMKLKMDNHVAETCYAMFKTATEAVKVNLEEMCEDLDRFISSRSHELYTKLEADCIRALCGNPVNQVDTHEEEKHFRDEIMSLLSTVNVRFRPIAEGRFPPQYTGDRHYHTTKALESDGWIPPVTSGIEDDVIQPELRPRTGLRTTSHVTRTGITNSRGSDDSVSRKVGYNSDSWASLSEDEHSSDDDYINE